LHIFERREKREELAIMLRERGYYVRLHAYEYLIMSEGKILCSIYIFPLENTCVINYNKEISGEKSKEKLYEIVSAIKTIDPEIKILIRETPKYRNI